MNVQNLLKVLMVLVLSLAIGASAAVKKKRFDVSEDGSSKPVATQVETSTVPDSAVNTTSEEPMKSAPTQGGSFHAALAQVQKDLREKVTAKIVTMKSGDWSCIWKFLLLCFVYGMLHALGPGHGKSIVIGFFLARRGRWRQGVALGAGITFTHTLSAVVLLFILYAIFKATVFPVFENGRGGIEMASYALLMITGLLLVVLGVVDFVKGRRRKCEGQENVLPPVARWKEIIGIAAVTGIVPCPAVALIVLFCLLNSMVGLALLGAVLVCIGMTCTNVLFGIGAVAFRKGIDKTSRASRFASSIYCFTSMVGGAVIFVSGLLLFSNFFAGRV